MNRKTFFKNLAALGVAVGIAPKVLAEEKQEGHVFNVELLEKRKRELERAPRLDLVFHATRIEEWGSGYNLFMDARHLCVYDALEEIDDNGKPTGNAYLIRGVCRSKGGWVSVVPSDITAPKPTYKTFFHFASFFKEK